jgi:hypothetical protein
LAVTSDFFEGLPIKTKRKMLKLRLPNSKQTKLLNEMAKVEDQ